jgi:hypothetical protein
VPKASLTGLDGWIPIAEKNLPYELTASFLLMADKPGVPKPIKLQEQHQAARAARPRRKRCKRLRRRPKLHRLLRRGHPPALTLR